MPSFTNLYVKPGTYVKIRRPQLPVIPSSIFIPAVIGIGRTDKDITSDAITKGSANDKAIIMTGYDDITSISQVIDELGNTYRLTTDYLLIDDTVVPDGKKETISWTPAIAAIVTGTKVETFTVSGLTFKMAINGGAVVTHTFASSFTSKTAAQIATDLLVTFTTALGYAIAAGTGGDTGKVVISTILTNGGIIEIVDGTANAVLGFSVGKTYGSKEPVTGKKYYVSFVCPKTADDYEPTLFADQNLIEDIYGDSDDLTGTSPDNTLSLGAKIMKQNGSAFIWCCQANVSGGIISGFEAAFDRLQAVTPWVIVPMLPISDTINTELLAYSKAHVNAMSNEIENKYRTVILGAQKALDSKTAKSTSIAAYLSIFASLNTARIPYIVSSKCQRLVGDLLIDLDGCYLAAAVAGICTNPTYDAGEPLSGKQIVGFTDISSSIYLNSELNYIAQYGGMIIEKEGTAFEIRHALTTDTTDAATQEFKVTKIQDYVADTTRTALTKAFVRTRNTGGPTYSSMKTMIVMLLDMMIPNIITDKDNINVQPDPVEPRQINVRFGIKPTWDIDWIYVEFGVIL